MSIVVKIDERVRERARRRVLAWMRRNGEDVQDQGLVARDVEFFLLILSACSELFEGRGALIDGLEDLDLGD